MTDVLLPLLLLLDAALATEPHPPVGPRVLLTNAAHPNTTMPVVGLGMPCGPSYSCSQDAYVGTQSFLALGGRRTDSADSYTGAEPGIGLAMREWMADGGDREELFIGSKIGPGGACWPLGYNESIDQAKMILGYYNQLNSTPGRSPPAARSVGQLDTLLVHWPVNGCKDEACGATTARAGAMAMAPGWGGVPCPMPDGRSIPTTDRACDLALPSYDARACRISTWRGMVAAWKMGLTRSIGVSNWNSTMIQDLVDAGLPLPALNQIQWEVGYMAPSVPFTPYPHTETFASEFAWCKDHGVLVNGYSPFGGHGQAGNTFNKPAIRAVAAARNVSAAQLILRWNYQLGVASNPMATNPAYQQENLDIFGFELTAAEMQCLDTLNASACPPPLPPPPPPPPPPFPSCIFTGVGPSAYRMDLSGLPATLYTLTDKLGDKYEVVSPCRYADGSASPGVESVVPGAPNIPKIPLGFATDLTVKPLPSGQHGLRLILGNGDPVYCNAPRTLWFDMMCDPTAPATAPPNTTMYITADPRSPPGLPACGYALEWRTPAACNVPAPTPDCIYELASTGAPPRRMDLSKLPAAVFELSDRLGDKYAVVSPCKIAAAGTGSPAVEQIPPHYPNIPLGYASDLDVAVLPSDPSGQAGMRLILGDGAGNPGCGGGRTAWFDMICDPTALAAAPPNATMFIYDDPRSPNIPDCVYRVEWRTPLACSTVPPPPPARAPPLPRMRHTSRVFRQPPVLGAASEGQT